MIEVTVGVEIRRYATVTVRLENWQSIEEANEQAEEMVLNEHSDVDWNEPSVSYSERLGEYQIGDDLSSVYDTAYEERHDEMIA